MSILFANAANYATAERDKLNWYEDKIVPEANFIASILNDQIFKTMNLHFEFLPETLDIFQEDERERGEAMNQFMDAMTKAQSIEMAQALFLIYGVEVSDEAMALIEKHFEGKEERREEMADNLSQPASRQPLPPPQEQEEPPPPPTRGADTQQLQRELSIWQSKCLAALKRGETAASIAFVPVHIPAENYERICDGLKEAIDDDAVKEAFIEAFREEPKQDPMDMFMAELASLKEMIQNPWIGYP